jgi:hypothetical protein
LKQGEEDISNSSEEDILQTCEEDIPESFEEGTYQLHTIEENSPEQEDLISSPRYYNTLQTMTHMYP